MNAADADRHFMITEELKLVKLKFLVFTQSKDFMKD